MEESADQQQPEAAMDAQTVDDPRQDAATACPNPVDDQQQHQSTSDSKPYVETNHLQQNIKQEPKEKAESPQVTLPIKEESYDLQQNIKQEPSKHPNIQNDGTQPAEQASSTSSMETTEQSPCQFLLQKLGMNSHFPEKLSTPNVLALRTHPWDQSELQDLPWMILEKLILMDSRCRDDIIQDYVSVKKASSAGAATERTSRLYRRKAQLVSPDIFQPHPMDVMLLLFVCADYKLRQLLANKLFMCRLAIPFIVPDPDNKPVMFIWPLRNITIKWISEDGNAMEESIINHPFNMVTFCRFGKTSFPKSKLVNEILSSNHHSVFYSKEANVSDAKRLISHGSVEMSHYAPAGKETDVFSKPLLIFNVRGDGCMFSQQVELMCQMTSVLVIIVDVAEIVSKEVVKRMKMLQNVRAKIVILLTNSESLNDEKIDEVLEELQNILGDEWFEMCQVIDTFDGEGKLKNPSRIVDETRKAIRDGIGSDSSTMLDQCSRRSMDWCGVDESISDACSLGKRQAESLLKTITRVEPTERSKLLPLQRGKNLSTLSVLLRKLHRLSENSETKTVAQLQEQLKEEIDLETKTLGEICRKDGILVTELMKKLVALQHDRPVLEFTLMWLQTKLDDECRQMSKFFKHLEENGAEELATPAQDICEAKAKELHAHIGLEHLMREIAQAYESLSTNHHKSSGSDQLMLSLLPEICASLLLSGHSFEILDGDHGIIPQTWIKAVLHSLAKKLGENKKIFIVSVLGIQSSGKSTLLNTMFGLEFAVSAGRCTSGIYAQLLTVDQNKSDLPFDYMLVLDSEGLRAPELGAQSYEYDNELATLVIGLADLSVINLKGENTAEMKDILQIVVHAFFRMKAADNPFMKQCMFIHQNVAALDAKEKMKFGQKKFHESLDHMTKEAAETQGLGMQYSAFNDVISFNESDHIWYFSDLWNGNPPMAPINHRYSSDASKVKAQILREIQENQTGCMTIPDFIIRINDMWNGVLADDFVFSFRNSLAVKAFIALEKEQAKLARQLQSEMLEWITSHCQNQITVCNTIEDLSKCHQKLCNERNLLASEKLETQRATLEEFFVSHPLKDILVAWKTTKLQAFVIQVEAIRNEQDKIVTDMYNRRMVELQQDSQKDKHEEEILKQAMQLASELQGSSLTDEVLATEFSKLWNRWSKDLPTPQECQNNIQGYIFKILTNAFQNEGNTMFLSRYLKEIGFEPRNFDCVREALHNGLSKEHITEKTFWGKMKRKVRTLWSSSDSMPEAHSCVETMLSAVKCTMENIIHQGVKFNQLQGEEIIHCAVREMKTFNGDENSHSQFMFTHDFQGFFLVHVACYAIYQFQKMDEIFESKHGVKAKMETYKRTVFQLFENTVKQKSIEVTASTLFCTTIKSKVLDTVFQGMKRKVADEILRIFSHTKYHLLVAILEDIAESRDFTALMTYTQNPFQYAKQWLAEQESNNFFSTVYGKSRYFEIASGHSYDLVLKLKESVRKASERAVGWDDWIHEFCRTICDHCPITKAHLSVMHHQNIKDFQTFEKALNYHLDKMAEELENEMSQVTSWTVQWGPGIGPYEEAAKTLWGCTEMCPFCHEPCQWTAVNHPQNHQCTQHKPPGVCGTKNKHTLELCLSICNSDVSSKGTHNCSACNYKCQNSGKCYLDRYAQERLEDFHPYKEYKRFMPDWDIAPDPSGQAAEYWKWIVCIFRDQLLQQYPGRRLDIPRSWYKITEEQALASLRKHIS